MERVHHARYGLLRLRADDLGIGVTGPEKAAIIADMKRPIGTEDGERPRDLLTCATHYEDYEDVECEREVKYGNTRHMYVAEVRYNQATGKFDPNATTAVLDARHLPLNQSLSSGESELHLALKEHLYTHAVAGGLIATMEDTSRTRDRRPDVVTEDPRPHGLILADEVQLKNIGVQAGRARVEDHGNAGMLTCFYLPNESFHLEDKVTYLTFSQHLTADMVASRDEIPVMSGARTHEVWKCGASGTRYCPTVQACKGWHFAFVHPVDVEQMPFMLGQVQNEVTLGSMVPFTLLGQYEKRRRTELIIPMTTWDEYRNFFPPDEEEAPEVDDDDQEVELIFPGSFEGEMSAFKATPKKDRKKRPPKRHTASLSLTFSRDDETVAAPQPDPQPVPVEAVSAPVAAPQPVPAPEPQQPATEPVTAPESRVVVLDDNGLDDDPAEYDPIEGDPTDEWDTVEDLDALVDYDYEPPAPPARAPAATQPATFQQPKRRPQTVRFPAIGNGIAGLVVDITAEQAREYGTREPKWNPDGTPRMLVALTLQTPLRETPGDDGLRILYAEQGTNLAQAIWGAASRAGAKGPRPGGWLQVTYTADGPRPRADFNPPKLYAAVYYLPNSRDVEFLKRVLVKAA